MGYPGRVVVAVDLQEFLFTGRFGPVELGMYREDVLGHFGLADLLGGTSRRHRTPAIWRYGSIEFHFESARGPLWLIHADDFDDLQGGSRIALSPWCLSGRLRREEAEDEFRAAGLGFRVHRNRPVEDFVTLVTAGGVALLFGRDPNDEESIDGLQAISRSGEDESAL
jgi:hypothetical protein